MGTAAADAIPILLRTADRAIEVRNRDSYQAAVRLLTEAKALFARCGRDGDFSDHMTAVRDAYRTKWPCARNLIGPQLP